MFTLNTCFLKNTLCTCGRALMFLLLSLPMTGQDITTPLMSETWQATFSNPALYGNMLGTMTIGLPGVHNDLRLENITYNELLAVENGVRIIDLNQVPDLLAERNEIRNDFTLETVGFGIQGDRFSFGLSHRLRAGGAINYPRTLIELAAEGNAQFIGQTVEIAPFGYASSFHEFGFGASHSFGKILCIGARVKYLSGVADISTNENASLQLTTGEDNFALSLAQDVQLNTSGIANYAGLDNIDVDLNFDNLGLEEFFNGNSGLAYDVGAFMDLGRIRLQAAANDLGAAITWKNDVTNLDFRGTDEFRGLDVLEQFLEDSISFAGVLDTLQAIFEPVESNEDYKTNIATTYILGGEFDLTERLTLGGILVHYDRPQASETAFGLQARYRFFEPLTLGVSYTSRESGSSNLGMNILANLGPFQLLASTDNLLTVFQQRDSSEANFRIGSSLLIGRDYSRRFKKKKKKEEDLSERM